jgi:orotate phosphoribosyltransferase
MDNGPEMVSQALQRFCDGKVGLTYIPPGCPWDNGYIDKDRPIVARCDVSRRWLHEERMVTMDRLYLAAKLNAVCRLSGQLQLRSGQHSTEYFDKYLFEADPELLKRVCQAMVPLIPPGTDLLGGLELGGVPIVAVVSQMTGIPTVFVRKEAKTYGTCRLAEGADVAGRAITLIEDVITTGGAVRNATLALRGDSADVRPSSALSTDGLKPAVSSTTFQSPSWPP